MFADMFEVCLQVNIFTIYPFFLNWYGTSRKLWQGEIQNWPALMKHIKRSKVMKWVLEAIVMQEIAYGVHFVS